MCYVYLISLGNWITTILRAVYLLDSPRFHISFCETSHSSDCSALDSFVCNRGISGNPRLTGCLPELIENPNNNYNNGVFEWYLSLIVLEFCGSPSDQA